MPPSDKPFFLFKWWQRQRQLRQNFGARLKVLRAAAIAQSIRLFPGFEFQAKRTLFKFYLNCGVTSTKIKLKEARVGPFLKKIGN